MVAHKKSGRRANAEPPGTHMKRQSTRPSWKPQRREPLPQKSPRRCPTAVANHHHGLRLGQPLLPTGPLPGCRWSIDGEWRAFLSQASGTASSPASGWQRSTRLQITRQEATNAT